MCQPQPCPKRCPPHRHHDDPTPHPTAASPRGSRRYDTLCGKPAGRQGCHNQTSAPGHGQGAQPTAEVKERAILVLAIATFLGMVGIYVGLYLAWQKYQASTAQGTTAGNVLGLLAKL